MAKYRHKDAFMMAYNENRKRIRLEGRILYDRLMNELLKEMTERFEEAETRGEILRIESLEDVESLWDDVILQRYEEGLDRALLD